MRIADGGRLTAPPTIQPKADAEMGLVLPYDLHDETTTAAQVGAATASVHAAIKIVDLAHSPRGP